MNKYKNIKVEYNGLKFDSKRECEYYKLLLLQQNAIQPEHKVVKIDCQVPYPIYIGDHKICKYYADFVVMFADGHTETIDAKGVKTAVYKLKNKLVHAIYGIEIKEV